MATWRTTSWTEKALTSVGREQCKVVQPFQEAIETNGHQRSLFVRKTVDQASGTSHPEIIEGQEHHLETNAAGCQMVAG